MALLLSLLVCSCIATASAGNFYQDFDVTWGGARAKILNNGELLTLSLYKTSGSGFQSKNEYLFGKIDMQLKVVLGNSAGTVTAHYLSSQGPTHNEIEWSISSSLGTSVETHTLSTPMCFTQGKGNTEQQFNWWFDPTKDFHTYSILWNPRHVIFSVDRIPIRDFKNRESDFQRINQWGSLPAFGMQKTRQWQAGLLRLTGWGLHLLHHTGTSE